MWCMFVAFFAKSTLEKEEAFCYRLVVLLPFQVSNVRCKVCCHVHLCSRVMSSPKLSNITNSMQYSALWMCLQLVCWIILLNKCVLRENSKNMVHNRGRQYNPTDCCGSRFITTLRSLLDSVFAPAIIHTKLLCVTFFSWHIPESIYTVYSRLCKDSPVERGGVVGKPYGVSVCLMFRQINSLHIVICLLSDHVLSPILHNVLSSVIASLETLLLCSSFNDSISSILKQCLCLIIPKRQVSILAGICICLSLFVSALCFHLCVFLSLASDCWSTRLSSVWTSASSLVLSILAA